ncbi:AAA family ATPase [Sulfurospirillum barnesii]|uniref:Rad50/SbcC-type AAA domain-containing protein n=1 Tax=Sulfurospirillum barnesii (strain ATCC 700032 / DSM 10660 / SES-3) TaxID=760154 RepID=I3XW18_SULBS|nr:AAA family ATPase [Sulfurospirillum barnesii]AFL68142.1 hypothetical protein Sulba_0840 [Sulfurospirillum barnesii SES-3]
MKLTNIVINNLFSYNGVSTISFDNITCIIGTNGFGKTSILNSIKLCLGQSDIDVKSILNNNATEKKCSVTLNFDEFSIKRSWIFAPKLEESLSIVFTDSNKIEDIEAEHFIKNKIPDFLVDFLFYDGEVGNNLLLLSNTKLKNIFDFIFDLDLLVNTQKDSLEVAKKLLEKNNDEESANLIDLENQRLTFLETISVQREELKEKTKEVKALAMNLQKLNTQIKNRNKKVKLLHDELELLQADLDKKSNKLKELILWQMPLLLNQNLLNKMQKRTSSALKIEDESLFVNKFYKFTQEINSPLDENKVLELFKSLMINESNQIDLTLSPRDFKKLIEKMKDLRLSIKQLEEKIKLAQDSAMEQEIMRSLVETQKEQEERLNNLEKSLTELEESIEQNTLEAKEINRTLTQSFKANQEKYAFIKGYEELRIIAQISTKVYNQKLEKNLVLFNQKLQDNTTKFLKQYEHIKAIYIDNSHRIIISDGKEILSTELLSAGQKQVLNFLIIKTILDFKEFTSFIMIDTPFGRLSNKNKELLLHTCYLSFDTLILLLTDSEFDFVKTQNLKYKTYQIERDTLGSKIEEIA